MPELDAHPGVCVQETNDCVQISTTLTAYVCDESQPDPTGFACFTPKGWIHERCCAVAMCH